MRLSSLVVAVLLFVSPVLFAQHSSGGGSSSGGSSSGGSSGGASGSGGSHSSYSGGSSSGGSSLSSRSSGSSGSSSSHSSGGSASRGSSAGSAATRSRAQSSRSGGGDAIREPGKIGVQDHKAVESGKNPQPEHRGLFAFLRHPFRRHAPKPAKADLRRPICKGKLCPCPSGETSAKNGRCIASGDTSDHNLCRRGEFWNGEGCVSSSLFGSDDCSNLALALNRQARQSQLTESLRQTSCSRDAAAQECSELTAKSQVETTRYRLLQQQFQRCRRQGASNLVGASGIN